jgi:multidrug resistance efflux pump
MAEVKTSAVRVKTGVPEIRHTIKAAQLLYSAPNYVLRGPIYLVFLVVFAGLIYSFIGETVESVACPLELVAETADEQAPTGGIVQAINVKEGDRIEAFVDAVVIQHRTTALAAKSEEEMLRERRESMESDKGWQQKQEQNLKERVVSLQESLKTSEQNQKLLEEKNKNTDLDFQDQIKSAEKKIQTIKIELDRAKGQLAPLSKQLELAESGYAENLKLFKDQLVTKPELDASDMKVTSARQAVSDAQSKVAQIEIQLSEAQNEPTRLKRQKEKLIMQHNEEILALSDRKAKLTYEISSINFQNDKDKQELLTAIGKLDDKLQDAGRLLPGVIFEDGKCRKQATYSGVVTKVYVKNNEQISAGQPLFSVVKDTAPIRARIYVANRDIGRVRMAYKNNGEKPVKIKYSAYDYREYGVQEGTMDEPSIKPTDRPGFEGMYEVLAYPKPDYIQKGNEHVKLTLGLQGLAEIEVGRKRLIEKVFSPISKFFSAEEE